MSWLYIDAFAGISGDMTVGAFLDLGLPLAYLREQLGTLHLHGYAIRAAARHVHGIAATKFDVDVETHGHAHRTFRDIRALLRGGGLAHDVQDRAVAVFAVLADAESRVHGVAPDDVAFHEVGAVDSIVDIVGAALGLCHFGIDRAYVSPVPLGSGLVRSQHGPIPVPGPATVELLKGFRTRPEDGVGELVTPTGAAILAAAALREPAPVLDITRIGYGAGTRTLADRPNVLRLMLARPTSETARDTLVVVETNIDDYNPEFYEHVMERLFAAGARDVFLAPVHMKKNRPGIVLSVLCEPADRDRIARLVVTETSAIGVRFHPVERLVLPRTIREVVTPFGPVRVKVAQGPDGIENIAPEYEDCRRVACERGMPIKVVAQAAVAAALARSDRNQ